MRTLLQFTRLSVFVLAGLSAVSALPAAAQTLSAEELTSLMGDTVTKVDHLKLAGHYDAEAEQLRESAARHNAMLSRYKKMPPRPSALLTHMKDHCGNLVTSLENAAKEAGRLAAAHREMAESSKSE